MGDRQRRYVGKGVVVDWGDEMRQLFPTVEPQKDSGAGSTKALWRRGLKTAELVGTLWYVLWCISQIPASEPFSQFLGMLFADSSQHKSLTKSYAHPKRAPCPRSYPLPGGSPIASQCRGEKVLLSC